jgi:hypothetical protein
MNCRLADKTQFFRWALLSAALLAACGGSETTSSTTHDGGSGSAGTAGGGSSGSSGSAGTTATGGTAGTEAGTNDVRSPRRCGHGAPCSPGAECSVGFIESGLDCECDESGHYFCDAWAGGGAPSQPLCPRKTGCSGNGGSAGTDDGSCSLTNGYCTRTCVCPGGTCTMACTSNGPPVSLGLVCDPSYCEDPGHYRCKVKDGSCDYNVECKIAETPVVTGRCD